MLIPLGALGNLARFVMNEYGYFGAINGDGPGVTPFCKPRKPLVLDHAFCIEADARYLTL